MTITPQLIKDQEFESKFRGFDPIEVKDYLETIADEFFELQEKCKEQEEELDLLREAKESSEEYNSSLETDMEFTRKISEELKDGCAQKEEKVHELTEEVEELQLRIADIEQESAEHDEEVSTVEAARKEVEEALQDVQHEAESLRNKIDILQEQNNDLKKEEVDFKSTLATAQRFAEDLKEKSQIEAEEIVAEARAEIGQIRDDAQEELDRLPLEIEALEKKKGAARTEVKALLENYLETIDVFFPEDVEETTEEADDPAAEDDGSDLFQKIVLDDDGSISSENAERVESSVDEKALDSLLRGVAEGEQGDDDQTLKELFSLDDAKEEKKNSF
jgi:cell division initiation protein